MFQCCSSLAVFFYLMDEDVTEILEVMRMYETIFSGSYLKVNYEYTYDFQNTLNEFMSQRKCQFRRDIRHAITGRQIGSKDVDHEFPM